MSTSHFLAEILEQPAVLSRLLTEGAAHARRAAEQIRQFMPEWVLVAARGSSDNAARYAQYLLGAHHRLGVGLALPSLVSLYGAPPRLGRALVIGISQSGQSPDIVGVVAAAAGQSALTLALTNDPDSPLARAAAYVLPLLAGEEKAVAATKTYSAELYTLAMLSAVLHQDAARVAADWTALERVPIAIQQVLESAAPSVLSAARAFAGAGKVVVIGRGFNYSTAFEIALKIKETSYLIAEPYSVADLLHGPVAMIDENFLAVVIAPSGPTLGEMITITEVLQHRGARVLSISDSADLLRRSHFGVDLPADLPEWLSPIAAVVAGQLFANALCGVLGRDPDRPRGLSKVTLTR